MLLSSGDTRCHVKGNTQVYCESLSYHTSHVHSSRRDYSKRQGRLGDTIERACPMEARSLSFFLDSVKMMPFSLARKGHQAHGFCVAPSPATSWHTATQVLSYWFESEWEGFQHHQARAPVWKSSQLRDAAVNAAILWHFLELVISESFWFMP